MARGRAYQNQSTLAVATGTNGSHNRSIPPGKLLGITIGPASSEGPVRVLADLLFDNQPFSVSVASGWARGPTQQPGGGALIRHFDIDIPRQSELRVFMRNDTGATVNVTVSYWGVRVDDR